MLSSYCCFAWVLNFSQWTSALGSTCNLCPGSALNNLGAVDTFSINWLVVTSYTYRLVFCTPNMSICFGSTLTQHSSFSKPRQCQVI